MSMNKESTERVRRANIRLHTLIAADYDKRQAIYHPAVMANLRKLLLPHIEGRSGRLLDVGCGAGYISRLLDGCDFDIAGFDITLAMIERARAASPVGAFVAADAAAIPFRENTFDAVAVSGVLHHLADYSAALREAAACLKPGGMMFILNEPCARGYRLFRPLRRFTKRFLPESRVKKHMDAGALRGEDELLAEYHLNFSDGIDPGDIERILGQCGVTTIELQLTDLNMIANLGDRLSIDILDSIPLLKKRMPGVIGFDFNLIASKKMRFP